MIVSAQHCISRDPFFDRPVLSESQPGKVYTVRINYPGDPPEQYTCTCPSFEFRGYCKHQQMVGNMRICKWHELIGPEKQTDEEKKDHICPRCGNVTVEELEETDEEV